MAVSGYMEPISPFIWGSGGRRLTPEEIAAEQAKADALLAGGVDTSPVGHWMEGLARVAQAGAGAFRRYHANKAEGANADWKSGLMQTLARGLETGTGLSSGSVPGVGPSASSPAGGARAASGGPSVLPASFLAGVDRTEGGGDYNTLYGHAQRAGRTFAGTNVSDMTIGQALAFAAPSGSYAQNVKGQIGRVATPMGRHQIVGNTLRRAANEMGLSLDTPFNAQTQDAIALHLAKKRIAGASTLDGKIDALRSEWHGFKGVPRAQMAQIVADLESATPAINRMSPEQADVVRAASVPQPAPMNTGITSAQAMQPVQVASMDPTAGMSSLQPPAGTNPINNRPILDNGDGSYSTEESITVTDPRLNGGAPTNIPSIWNGRRTANEDEAVIEALRSGEQFPAFGSIDEAVSAAQERSDMLGAGVPGGEPDMVQQLAQSLLSPSPMAQGGAMQAPMLPAGPTTQAQSMPMPGASPMPMMQPGQYSTGLVPPAGASQMVPPVASVPASLNGLPDAAPLPTPRDLVAELARSEAARPQAPGAPTMQQQIAQAVAPKFTMDPNVIAALTDPRGDAQLRQFGNMVLQHQLGQYQSEQQRYLQQQQAAAELAQRQQAAQLAGVDPNLALDSELWKAGVGDRFRAPPAEQQNLAWRAKQAGLVPGSPEYVEFMLSNGSRISPDASGFRQATQEEAAAYGVPAGQFGPDGRFYPVNPPPGMSIESDGQGGFRLVQGAGVGAGGKLTESQGKDIGFYTRGIEADARLAELDTFLTDWAQENAAKLPLGIGNYLRDPKFRQAKQAADSFLTALLRKDTGAAITANEFEIYGPMFLPVPADDADTIQMKRRARQVALLALRSGLGTADAIAEANRILLGLPETELPPPPGGADDPNASGSGGWQDMGGVRIRRKQ